MVTQTLQSLESYASFETQLCSLAAVGFAAGAVVLGSTAGIICATSLIITYGCIYHAYVTKPSQKIAQEKISSLEDNLRNCQREKLEGEQRAIEQSTRALEQSENLNREIEVLKEKNDNINKLASETNTQLIEIQRTVKLHYEFSKGAMNRKDREIKQICWSFVGVAGVFCVITLLSRFRPHF